MKKISLTALLIIITITLFAQKTYNIKDFGAIGNGTSLDTKAINEAITQCSLEGGGIVLFPKGNIFLTGSIHLLSNIEYCIEKGAVIKGAPNGINAYDIPEENQWSAYQDFGHSFYRNSLIWGENIENISFTGGGEINGGGITRKVVKPGDGNKAIALKLCKNILFENITVINGGWFAFILNGCSDIKFNRIKINTVRDGIDLMSCSNVVISNSEISSIRQDNGKAVGGDDAIGIKSDYALGKTLSSENILIENCVISSGCNAIQFGSETVGDFKNIRVENCVINGADKAGLGITSNDGSVIDNVLFKNIIMTKVSTPIFMYVSDRLRTPDPKKIGKIKNITIENVAAYDCYGYIKNENFTSTISGHKNSSIDNVKIKNLTIVYKGGVEKGPLQCPENSPTKYTPKGLGVRPASGFYIRNAKNILMSQIAISFEKPDYRPPFVFDTVDSLIISDPTISSNALIDVELINTNGFSQTGVNKLKVNISEL
ncbi:MAG: hypothetical protein GZ091_08135 [Paludibacter sp.]|nr:hypothetical protein [Paludibacter sp.]